MHSMDRKNRMNWIAFCLSVEISPISAESSMQYRLVFQQYKILVRHVLSP